ALLGLAQARGTVLVAGPGAALAPAVAALVPEVEVVAFGPPAGAGEEASGVSRVAGGPALPFRARAFHGVALTGGADDALLAEGLRVVAPGSRLLVEGAAPGTAERLGAMGAEVLLEEEGVVVARSRGELVPLRVNALR
ncbi:MAG TPA: hypothetical protein VFR81_16345, partial [Longimicrobium sp.]|nr:hypothetical protein [Longimicrobium sp.]